MTDYILLNSDELYHYGVPGMKWGHRKAAQYYTKKANRARSMANYETAQRKKVVSSGNYNPANKYQAKANAHKKALPTSSVRNKVNSTKAEYKSAKKAYSKAYNKAYNNSALHPISQFASKKGKAKSDALWDDAYDKAASMRTAKTAYKTAKAERRTAIDKAYRKIDKKTSFGEKLMYNSATREKAAKYVVDNNMSYAEASKRAKGDALRNTAALMAAYGAVSIGLYAASNRR